MSYANQAGTPARDQPMLQATAQTIVAEGNAINDRLHAVLLRLHPPQPHVVDTPVRGEDGPRAVPTLFSMLGAAQSLQQRSHQLLTEIESLV